MNYFKNVDDFYKNFYKNLDKNLENFFNIKKKIIYDNKIKFPHYSISDINFRLDTDKKTWPFNWSTFSLTSYPIRKFKL